MQEAGDNPDPTAPPGAEPLAFAPDDEASWQRLALGYRLAGLLLSAHRLGLLRRLAEEGQARTEQLARDLLADPGIVEQMCRALAGGGLLRCSDAGWRLSDAGRRLATDPAAAVEMEVLATDYQAWGGLDQRARRLAAGETPLDHDGYDAIRDNVGAARRYALRLSARHRTQARDLVTHLRPSRPVKVVDLGGGDGLLSREICSQWPDASCVVLEQPAVAEVARRSCGRHERITVIEGDFFHGGGGDALPGDADLVVLSHVLLGLPADLQRGLTCRVGHVLAPGGCVLSCESVLRFDAKGPMEVLLWAVGQAAMAHRGHVLTTNDQDLLLRAAGLAASAAWWVSDSTRAVLGVHPDVGVAPAVRVREHLAPPGAGQSLAPPGAGQSLAPPGAGQSLAPP
ncbi:MAG: methyltransferase, partial [Egibacteraceae bacterium]